MTDVDYEIRAVLSRSAHVEAERQRAKQDKDWPRLAQCERELAALWRRHADLERRSA